MTAKDEGLERIFERAREPVPRGLEERLMSGLRAPEVARRYEQADREEIVARVLRFSLVAFLLAAIAFAVVVLEERSGRASVPAPVTRTIEDELLAFSQPLRSNLHDSLWPQEAK